MDDDDFESKITPGFVTTAIGTAVFFDILSLFFGIGVFVPVFGIIFTPLAWGVDWVAWLTFIVMFNGSSVKHLRKNSIRRSAYGFLAEFFLGVFPLWTWDIWWMIRCAKQEEKKERSRHNKDTSLRRGRELDDEEEENDDQPESDDEE